MAEHYPNPPAKLYPLPDGRQLAYRSFGVDQEALPRPSTVFYLHGSLSSSLEAALWHTAAIAEKICLIAVDRPGTGDSTFNPAGSLLSFASDLQDLTRHLQVLEYSLLGVSGGGPFVLACLHANPARDIISAAIVSGLYPPSLGLGGMAFAGRALLWVAPWATSVVAASLDFGITRVAQDTEHPERFEALIERDLNTRTERDRMVLAGTGKKQACMRAFREGLKQGARSAAWDSRSIGWNWGFEVEDLKGPTGVTLWHGSEDSNCPLRMTRAAAEKIKGSELIIKEGEAHLSMTFGYVGEVLQRLINVR